MNAFARSSILAPALLLAAACSGNTATGPVQHTTWVPGLSEPQARTAGARPPTEAYVYACTLEPKCSVFTADGERIRTVTKGLLGPVAIVSDPQGIVYVDDAAAGQILRYTPGMSKLIGSLSAATGFDIALHDGTLAVSGGTSVEVFPPGSGTPVVLTDSRVMQGNGIAFDSQGNCYWSVTLNDGLGTVRIDAFTGCSGTATHVTLPGAPTWLVFDGSDNLYYASGSRAGGIYRCAGLVNCSVAYGRHTVPRAIRFDEGWQHLYVADMGTPSISRIDIATGKVDETIKKGFKGYSAPIGVAAGPGPG